MAKILVVDDDPDTREILSVFLPLHAPHHHYDFASDAQMACRMFDFAKSSHEDYDLVITDIAMPVMDGCELARYVRRADSLVLIVMLTGFDYTPEIDKCAEEVGVAGKLTKPDELLDVPECINTLLVQKLEHNALAVAS